MREQPFHLGRVEEEDDLTLLSHSISFPSAPSLIELSIPVNSEWVRIIIKPCR